MHSIKMSFGRVAEVLLCFACGVFLYGEDGPEILPPLIYVPYEHLPDSVLSSSVLMPYEHYLNAWKEIPVSVPIPAVLVSFNLTGVLGLETCALTLRAEVTALAPAWSHIDLPMDLPLTGFSASDSRVTIERGNDGVHLHLPSAGSYKVNAELLYPVIHTETGSLSVSLNLPLSATGLMDLSLPDSIHDVVISPTLAQTISADANGRHLHCVLGGTPTVTLSWQPPFMFAAAPLVLAQEDVLTRCSGRSLQEDVSVHLDISRHSITDCDIVIPESMQLLAVGGASIRNWDLAKSILHIHFISPQAVETRIQLRFEQSLSAVTDGQARTIGLSIPGIPLAERIVGSLVLSPDESDPVTIAILSHDGLSQVDPTRLGFPNASAAFTYLSPFPTVGLRLTKEAPDVRCQIEELLQLGIQADRIDIHVGLEVRKAGIYSCSCLCPDSWELLEIHGNGLDIDDSRMGPADHGYRKLQISFKNRLMGNGDIQLQLHSPASIPRHPGNEIAIADLKVFSVAEANQTHGTVTVLAPSNWAISSRQRAVFMGADVQAIAHLGAWPAMLAQVPADSEAALAFNWTLGLGESGPNPIPTAQLTASARPQEINVHVSDAVTVSDGVVHQSVTWHGEVRYSPITSFRIVVPSAWDQQVVFHGSGIVERSMVAHSLADGATTWELRFAQPVLGGFTCILEHTVPLPQLHSGIAQTLSLAPVQELNVTRSEHDVAVSREGTIEITATDQGMSSISPSDVPSELQHEGIVAAFQGSRPGLLSLSILHHEDVRLADASITLARYQAVLGEDGVLRVHALLHVESRGRPDLELHLPPHADLLEMCIDQHQGHPSRRDDGTIMVPLPAVTDVSTLMIAYVYSVPVSSAPLPHSGVLTIQLPTMGDEGHSLPLPVQQVGMSLYLPENLLLGHQAGDLTELESPTLDGSNAEEDGLTVHVSTVGMRTDFVRLGGGGQIRIWYLTGNVATAIGGASLLLAILIFTSIRKSRYAAIGLAITGIIFFSILAGTTSIAFAMCISGFALTGIAACGWRAISSWKQRRRAWNQTAALVSDDPWLENGPLANSTDRPSDLIPNQHDIGKSPKDPPADPASPADPTNEQPPQDPV